jgi:hypothetical protein
MYINLTQFRANFSVFVCIILFLLTLSHLYNFLCFIILIKLIIMICLDFYLILSQAKERKIFPFINEFLMDSLIIFKTKCHCDGKFGK